MIKKLTFLLLAITLSFLIVPDAQAQTWDVNQCFKGKDASKCPLPCEGGWDADGRCVSNGANRAMNINSCSNAPGWMLTTRIVTCIQLAVVRSLQTFFPKEPGSAMQEYLKLLYVAALFAVILFGIKIFGMEPRLNRMGFLLLLKIGLVVWYVTNLHWIAIIPLEITVYMSHLVVGGWSPWTDLDLYLGKIVGFAPTDGPNGTDFSNGLLSLVGSALMSGLSGSLLFIIGSLSILTTLYFGFRAVFTYCAALLLIGFIMMISPFLVPFALFEYGYRFYFKKWLDLLIGAMLNPIFLFAFLWVFLGIIRFIVDTIVVVILGGNEFGQWQRDNQQLFSWVAPTDPRILDNLGQALGTETPTDTAYQDFAGGTTTSVVEYNPLTSFTLDFGANQIWNMQLLTFSFLGLFLVAYVMISLMGKLPELADSISGVYTGIEFKSLPLLGEARQAVSKLSGAGG